MFLILVRESRRSFIWKFSTIFFVFRGTESQEGMGLGLAIARRLVQAMGGKIWVESELGAGCEVFFLDPLKPAVATGNKGKNR